VIVTKLKPRLCKQCREKFLPDRIGQTIHRECVHAYALRLIEKKLAAKAKTERAQTRARKEAVKSRTKWLAECQAIANKYARLRDRADGCISCDKPASWDGQWHGSHYRSVGAASAVRLNLWNIHKACSVCNHHLSGNIASYKPRLIEKIGADRVEWLEGQNQIVRQDVAYLEKYKRVMGKRLRRMEKRMEDNR
jgi:hypothetical protein